MRATSSGLLRVDKKKVADKAHLDGTYLLCSSDPKLSAENIALGCKQPAVRLAAVLLAQSASRGANP